MDKEELKFMFQYMPNSELLKFKQLCKSMALAVQINNDPEFVKESINNFVKKYPFTKKCFDEMLSKYK
jgi:hypothetical protein